MVCIHIHPCVHLSTCIVTHESTQLFPLSLGYLSELITIWPVYHRLDINWTDKRNSRGELPEQTAKPKSLVRYWDFVVYFTFVWSNKSVRGLLSASPPLLFFNFKPSFHPSLLSFLSAFLPSIPSSCRHCLTRRNLSTPTIFFYSSVNINSIWVIFTGVGKMNALH